MTYSPYGDRDSGGTRTDVDTEVHDDHDQEDRADDGIGHDANEHDVNEHDAEGYDADEHDANGYDVNEHDGGAAPFQRDSTDDESVGGEVVDHDGNVVEATDADAEQAHSTDADADNVAVADTEEGIDEDPDSDVRADEASVNRYDTDTHTDRTAATDGALDSNGPTDVPDGDVPHGDVPERAADADYVAVGVAEPMSESAVADVAGPDGSDTTRAADDGAEPFAAEPFGAEPSGAEPFDAAAEDGSVMDGTAVGMMPGDAPVPDAPVPVPVPNANATHDRWQQIQLGFIDDPRGSVELARSLVVEAVEARISALRDRQTALDGWQSEATPDTEVLRAAIQGYRDMLHSLTDTP